ncbi:hypothetical protein J4216_05160 [Candidatus Woesearchaeota archaeon]|nr:hypothetical protein [Candidatus Woesearchaeota archaeon]
MVNVFVVLSGVGDRGCKVFNGATPLEVAKTKNLDYFASNGNGGYFYPINEHVAPENDEAIMALLGTDPQTQHYGRGAVEAYAVGIGFKKGYLALRTNFSTVEKEIVLDKRTGRSLTSKEAEEFARSLNENIKLEFPFVFKPTFSHRGILMFKGNFSDNITNVDLSYKKIGKFGVSGYGDKNKLSSAKPLDPESNTRKSAKIVNDFVKQSQDILSKHPLNEKRKKNYLLAANVVVPRDAGVSLPVLNKNKGWGAIVSSPLEKGFAALSGMKIIDYNYPEIKNHDIYDTLYKGIKVTVKHAIKQIQEGEFKNYFIHFREFDIAGKDNRPKEKVKMIEFLDGTLFKFLRKNNRDLNLVITSDHSTPCDLRANGVDPVPLIHFGKGKQDGIQRFTEHECFEGHYKKMYGKEVMHKVGFL